MNYPFDFLDTVQLTFDNKKDDWHTIIEHIKQNRGTKLKFDIENGKENACGDGANRFVYQQIAMDLVQPNSILIFSSTYFVEPDLKNDFWTDDDNIYAFVIFIDLLVSSESVLPYHLSPAILEYIVYRKLNMEELLFYLSKIDHEIYEQVTKLNDAQIKELNIGFDTVMEYIRSKVIGHITPEQDILYTEIASGFSCINIWSIYDVMTIDKILSGPYMIVPDNILQIMTVHNEQYTDQWSKFIRSLSEYECRQLLLLFGNTISLGVTYDIYIEPQSLDINISTCTRKIMLNEKLFTNDEALEQLRIYLVGNDSLNEGYGVDDACYVDNARYVGNAPRITFSYHSSRSRWPTYTIEVYPPMVSLVADFDSDNVGYFFGRVPRSLTFHGDGVYGTGISSLRTYERCALEYNIPPFKPAMSYTLSRAIELRPSQTSITAFERSCIIPLDFYFMMDNACQHDKNTMLYGTNFLPFCHTILNSILSYSKSDTRYYFLLMLARMIGRFILSSRDNGTGQLTRFNQLAQHAHETINHHKSND